MVEFHATTICAVRRGPDDIAIGGDGQVTMGQTAIMKNGAKKVKKIYNNQVLTGFAGSVADAFSLTEKFEKKLEEHSGNLKRAAVDLAQMWRSDRGMRNLEALMIVVDKDDMLVISGTGEVIAPDQDFVAIGSGGNFAYSAANALFNHTDMSAAEVVEESLKIASSICVYTNDNISVERL
ncbi:MAG: ATP-dependent protease subunit HslV [[Eubacterium] sulci]|jgi:ATP-dependent protease hslVU, peptidase subunit|nr:ATP-dependent protease HslVU, peptidase subunit [Eubacterium sulci ATCC 35585]MBF1130496.1 ATP-dependent protease subunit HslV [[Eubacterium] sulci]MBF1135884.1 ATP-dependent protease subunit HslV [[Eubacterium] sulci]MBF1137676.1 ATP-dependent protease subunit HslV [[Eubacterium] sulci]MBF1142378.1 ATP-dependent protease subunit HslV [[Eubacterium] sulci]